MLEVIAVCVVLPMVVAAVTFLERIAKALETIAKPKKNCQTCALGDCFIVAGKSK